MLLENDDKEIVDGFESTEDVLDNVNARRNTRHAGQILFWNNEGLENNKKFTDFYEAFVKINLDLFGNAEDNTLLKRFYSNNDKIQKAVKEFKVLENLPILSCYTQLNELDFSDLHPIENQPIKIFVKKITNFIENDFLN